MRSYTGVPLGSETCSIQYRLFGKVDEHCGGNFPDDTGLLVGNISSVWTAAKKFLRLNDWIIKWQMKSSISKCKMMSWGKNNPNFTNRSDCPNLTTAIQKQDLKVK